LIPWLRSKRFETKIAMFPLPLLSLSRPSPLPLFLVFCLCCVFPLVVSQSLSSYHRLAIPGFSRCCSAHHFLFLNADLPILPIRHPLRIFTSFCTQFLPYLLFMSCFAFLFLPIYPMPISSTASPATHLIQPHQPDSSNVTFVN
jgi:hypothetical protein